MKKLFNPVRYKETTKEQWQTAAEAWHRWLPTLKSWCCFLLVALNSMKIHNRLDVSLVKIGEPLTDWSLESIFDSIPLKNQDFIEIT